MSIALYICRDKHKAFKYAVCVDSEARIAWLQDYAHQPNLISELAKSIKDGNISAPSDSFFCKEYGATVEEVTRSFDNWSVEYGKTYTTDLDSFISPAEHTIFFARVVKDGVVHDGHVFYDRHSALWEALNIKRRRHNVDVFVASISVPSHAFESPERVYDRIEEHSPELLDAASFQNVTVGERKDYLTEDEKLHYISAKLYGYKDSISDVLSYNGVLGDAVFDVLGCDYLDSWLIGWLSNGITAGQYEFFSKSSELDNRLWSEKVTSIARDFVFTINMDDVRAEVKKIEALDI